jgi:pyridoxine kinase
MGDVIVPNITEAAFMTGMPYKEQYDEAYVKELLQKLAALGAKTVVLTGVSLSEGKTGVMGFDTEKQTYFTYQNDRVPAAYHGTGDIYCSVVVGALMRGISWQDAVRIAADYTARTIEVTLENPAKPWYGVDFEATIPDLLAML